MFQRKSRFGKSGVSLIGVALLAISSVCSAETFEFKVVYAQVPGIQKILAGEFDTAIARLETRASDSSNNYLPDETATLCALYVVTGNLDAGRKTCQTAVEVDRSFAAYNNRGVFRAHQGDAEGALEDFRRARVSPEHERRYIEDLKRRNARLMASRNFDVATAYIARRKNGRKRKAGIVTAGTVEDLNN